MSFIFEWDPQKASGNEKKHGVDFDEGRTVFADSLARIFDDPDHSLEERREIIIGHSAQGRLLVICFTERGDHVRIISARRASRRERKSYEETV